MEACQFVVCIGYNETYDYFYPALFALLESKSEEAYIRLHQGIKNISGGNFSPQIWTLDFEAAHINVPHNK